jgi:hypothetical protein
MLLEMVLVFGIAKAGKMGIVMPRTKTPRCGDIAVLRLLILMLAFCMGLVADEKPTVSTTEVIEGNLREYGERVVIRGLVRGDVWAAGSEIVVDGVILGDLYALAGSIRISGQVQGDVRVLGAQVQVNGLVGGHSRFLGAQVNTGSKAQLLSSCYIAAGAVDLAGKVAGNSKLHVGNANLRGQFLGRLEVTAGEIEVLPTAKLAQGLEYWSRRPASISPSADIKGKVISRSGDDEQDMISWITPWLGESAVGLLRLIVELMNLLYLLMAGLFLLWLFPQDVKKAVHCLRKKPGGSLGVGMVSIIVVPLVSFLFLITVLGIPVALTILALNVFGLYTAKVVVICLMGDAMLPTKWRQHRVGAFLLGVPVYILVCSIPGIGPVLGVLSMVWGLGATVLSHRELAHPHV